MFPGTIQNYQKPRFAQELSPGQEKFPVQRFLCPLCGRTVSVLPANRLTYRPLEVERLQGAFDAQAGVSGGLDPPPEPVEAGCLQRAWTRFLTRAGCLRSGQIRGGRAGENRPTHPTQGLDSARRKGGVEPRP
jgi:hypothetical protein